MLLVCAEVGPFKSLERSQEMSVDESVTVLVGMNEAGKTALLKALQKANDALGLAHFDPLDDYPKKDLPRYFKQHQTKPAQACRLTYRLSDQEVAELNSDLRTR